MAANGSHAVYTCDKGFTINGLAARECQGDGSGWGQTDPVCGKQLLNS